MFKKFLIFCCLFSYGANASENLKLNLPSLKITQLDGRVFNLEEQKNKVTLIMFWANWCPNCKRDMPQLEQSFQKYKDRGFNIIAISTDSVRQKAKVEAIAAKFSYPIALASDVIQASFSPPSAVPVYYLIGKDGNFLGEIFMQDNFERREFEKLLEKNLTQ